MTTKREIIKLNKEICPYCSELKYVKVWGETGEKVCFGCRLDLLETEFEEIIERMEKDGLLK